MHTFILISHIVAMIASMGLMGGAVVMGLMGKRSAASVATMGMIITVIGVMGGAILLLGAPLSIQCATLTGYLLAATGLYVFGFGMGQADDARLIRSSVKNR